MNVKQLQVFGDKIQIMFSDQFSETSTHNWGGKTFDLSDKVGQAAYIKENAEWAEKRHKAKQPTILITFEIESFEDFPDGTTHYVLSQDQIMRVSKGSVSPDLYIETVGDLRIFNQHDMHDIGLSWPMRVIRMV